MLRATSCTLAIGLFKLIAGYMGWPLSDIATSLDHPDLQRDAWEVLCTQVFSEKQIATHSEKCFRVRIMPYRTQDNVINGVVITFFDITEYKVLEAALRKERHEKEHRYPD